MMCFRMRIQFAFLHHFEVLGDHWWRLGLRLWDKMYIEIKFGTENTRIFYGTELSSVWTQILDNRRASTLCFMDLESWINLILIGDIFLATTNWKPQNYSSTNKYEHKLKTNVTFKIISLWIKHQTNTYFQVKPNLKTQIRYFSNRLRL